MSEEGERQETAAAAAAAQGCGGPIAEEQQEVPDMELAEDYHPSEQQLLVRHLSEATTASTATGITGRSNIAVATVSSMGGFCFVLVL